MTTILLTLPNDGDTIDASDVNTPFNAIADVINGGIDSTNITDGGVTPADLVSGTGSSWAWSSWTPTWANFTTTNLTVDAKYRQVGKIVYFRLHAVGGAGSASGTAPTFTLPVTSVATPSTAMPIGQGNYMSKNAWLSWASTTTALLRCWDVNNDLGTMSATNPATFTNGSVMDFYGQYEAA